MGGEYSSSVSGQARKRLRERRRQNAAPFPLLGEKRCGIQQRTERDRAAAARGIAEEGAAGEGLKMGSHGCRECSGVPYFVQAAPLRRNRGCPPFAWKRRKIILAHLDRLVYFRRS